MDVVYIVRYVYDKAIIALFYDFYDALECAEWEEYESGEEIEILTKKVW
jgi:hypothetical protein